MIWYILFVIYSFFIVSPYITFRTAKFKKAFITMTTITGLILITLPYLFEGTPVEWVSVASFMYLLCFIVIVLNVEKRTAIKKTSTDFVKRKLSDYYKRWEITFVLGAILVIVFLLVLVPIATMIAESSIDFKFLKWLFAMVVTLSLMWNQRYNRYNIYALILFSFPVSIIASLRFLAVYFPYLENASTSMGTSLITGIMATTLLGYLTIRQREEW